jgi:hypothetical protein
MTNALPPHIWFVRSNGGMGSYPVTAEGRAVVRNFVVGVAASVVIAAILAALGPYWLWPLVFIAGMALSAWYFIATARRHTDYTLTYNDYAKAKNNA